MEVTNDSVILGNNLAEENLLQRGMRCFVITFIYIDICDVTELKVIT